MERGGRNMEKTEQILQGKDLDIIEGEFVRISQSTVRNVEGNHVEMQQVATLSIDGEKIETTQSGTLLLRGENVSLHQSVAGVLIGDNTSLSYSCTPFSLCKGETTINSSAVGIIASGTVRTENSASLLLLANRVEGDVTTLFDWKSALALGGVLGGIFGIFSLLRRK